MAIVLTGDGITAYQMLALRSMLKLEILGMHHSRGSAYATIKRAHGYKGDKRKVLEQYETDLRAKGILS